MTKNGFPISSPTVLKKYYIKTISPTLSNYKTASHREPFSLHFYSTFSLQTCPPQSTKLITYADDISLISQHPDVNTAPQHTQEYLHSLENWLITNRMTASSLKSSITLLTTDRHQSSLHPLS